MAVSRLEVASDSAVQESGAAEMTEARFDSAFN